MPRHLHLQHLAMLTILVASLGLVLTEMGLWNGGINMRIKSIFKIMLSFLQQLKH